MSRTGAPDASGWVVVPLTPTDYVDYLDFHDRAFRDHREWQHCYCLSFIATPAEWDMLNAVDRASSQRRRIAESCLAAGRIRGYLARDDSGAVVGWCAAADKTSYARLSYPETPDGYLRSRTGFIGAHTAGRTKSVTCFLIDPDHRHRGVATALLQRVVSDARAEGCEAVEGCAEGTNAFTGPLALYEHAGFAPVAVDHDMTIMRLLLIS